MPLDQLNGTAPFGIRVRDPGGVIFTVAMNAKQAGATPMINAGLITQIGRHNRPAENL